MKPIQDADLHAYVDGQLQPARRLEVEAWLAQHPGDAERVRAWSEQNRLLHERLDGVLTEAVPTRLLAAAGRPPASWQSLLRAVAGVAGIGLAMFTGYAIGLRSAPPLVVPVAALQREAAIAHAVYVAERRHPVEVSADDATHLVSWLSKRLDRRLEAPDFTAAGFELLGGRLLAGDNGPVALFMYQDRQQRRVTLYVRRESASPVDAGTSFRYASEEGVGVFYWLDGESGYALSGSLDKRLLLDLATLAYHQLGDG